MLSISFVGSTMKKTYKELRKKLKDKFVKQQGTSYNINSSLGLWLIQSDIKPTPKHINIICTIFGSVPYPYQAEDRGIILTYLKNNKYKDFKNALPK
jgi:hypothetical protein